MPFDVTLQDRRFDCCFLRMIPTEASTAREVLGCCCKRLKPSQAVLVQYRHTITGDEYTIMDQSCASVLSSLEIREHVIYCLSVNWTDNPCLLCNTWKALKSEWYFNCMVSTSIQDLFTVLHSLRHNFFLEFTGDLFSLTWRSLHAVLSVKRRLKVGVNYTNIQCCYIVKEM